MTEANDTHPLTEFLHETGQGKVAYSPSSEIDTGRHWIFNWENGGFNFNFVVHDRDGVLGYEIYSKGIQWIGHFIHPRNFEYVEQPCNSVQELVEESVEIREEPLDMEEVNIGCSECLTNYKVSVLPKMDLVINGEAAQRFFVETCPECGNQIVEKKTYPAGSRREYPEDRSDIDATELWKHSRRTL